MEAKYRSLAHIVAKTVWLCQLLTEQHRHLHQDTIVYCDNVPAVYMSCNHVQQVETKHIEIEIYFVRDKVARRGTCSSCSKQRSVC